MRINERRCDFKTVEKIVEVRNMMKAFGSSAAKRFADKNLIDSAVFNIAISNKYERRQRLRRLSDRKNTQDSVPSY